MITVDYVQTMARYNRWQNAGYIELASSFDDVGLRADRGGFFGSIFATLNHVLWADRIWMSRIDGWTQPDGGIAESVDAYPTFLAWRADRERADSRLVAWAERLRPAQLRGDLSWWSGAAERDMRMPIALCVMHMFNHQTHHRGQLHAMLTSAGKRPQATDLFLMPVEH